MGDHPILSVLIFPSNHSDFGPWEPFETPRHSTKSSKPPFFPHSHTPLISHMGKLSLGAAAPQLGLLSLRGGVLGKHVPSGLLARLQRTSAPEPREASAPPAKTLLPRGPSRSGTRTLQGACAHAGAPPGELWDLKIATFSVLCSKEEMCSLFRNIYYF